MRVGRWPMWWRVEKTVRERVSGKLQVAGARPSRFHVFTYDGTEECVIELHDMSGWTGAGVVDIGVSLLLEVRYDGTSSFRGQAY